MLNSPRNLIRLDDEKIFIPSIQLLTLAGSTPL